MAVKIKELKDDALVSIKINKNYYYMLKGTLFYLFKNIPEDSNKEDILQKIMKSEYNEMTEFEQCFYTIMIALTEIERVATEENLYDEKEVLEPGDEGYTPPTQA